MHTRRNLVTLVALCSLFMAAWLEAREPARPLAEMAVGASRIDWQPAGDTGRLVLTVAGPEGLWLSKEFEAGQPAFLSLSDRERFPNGAYTYELRQISGQVQSGHFSIKNGSFVTAPPKPPLRNVTANLTDDELIIQGNACIGEECTTSDDDFPVLRLKGQNPNILFDDVEGPPSLLSSSFNDWAIRINASDVAKFSIVDFDGALTPFSILGGAPDNSLFISDNGDVGMGTATPADKLHLFDNTDVGTVLRVENTSSGANALGSFRAQSDTAVVHFRAHGSARTISRFGVVLGGWSEIVQDIGNGLAIGTQNSTPIILGTNNTNRLQINGSTGAVTVSGNLTVNGTFSNPSSRELKESFQLVDPKTVLSKFARLPIQEWSYKSDARKLRHVGPTVEDFQASFGLGTEGQHIFPMDVQGVTMTAVQGLYQLVQEKDGEIAALRERLAILEELVSKLAPQ